MKKSLKKALTVLMAALLLVGVYAPVASAETQSVIIHVQDGEGWGSMNIYNWGDAGETAGVWPGTELKVEADNWYTFTLETEVDLNLVLSATGGSPQSGNVDPITPDAGEVWIVVGGEGEANPLSGDSTVAATLYLDPQEGFPVAAVTDVTAETTEAADSAETTGDVPKTGEPTAMPVTLLALAAVSITGAIVLKRKAQCSVN